ncbi:hypothetical protein [Nocardia jinanensis]|uniref:Uncharacterized protein n=1 Tax=Nocardia jinanensis TaxID=382504 RepID=A0A917RS48_9NOCA|nr:hypothetical protein [Nocardia jinanensis]GGL20977.1 hypothetical protein GCM10011588_39760 [Nocardia jinanensis]
MGIRPPGECRAGRAAMIGFRHRGDNGLNLRVADIPAVTVVIEFGGSGLTVDGSDSRRGLTPSAATGRGEHSCWIGRDRPSDNGIPPAGAPGTEVTAAPEGTVMTVGAACHADSRLHACSMMDAAMTRDVVRDGLR